MQWMDILIVPLVLATSSLVYVLIRSYVNSRIKDLNSQIQDYVTFKVEAIKESSKHSEQICQLKEITGDLKRSIDSLYEFIDNINKMLERLDVRVEKLEERRKK